MTQLDLPSSNLIDAPVIRADATGTLRVGSSRVTLDALAGSFNRGSSAEEIAQQFESLTLAEVYAAIGYYLRNAAQVDTYLSQRRAQAGAQQARIEAAQDLSGIRARLRNRS